MIVARITSLELNEEFECRLIRLCFQALEHFLPMFLEQIPASATRFVGQTPLLEGLDDDATGARMLSPALDSPVQ